MAEGTALFFYYSHHFSKRLSYSTGNVRCPINWEKKTQGCAELRDYGNTFHRVAALAHRDALLKYPTFSKGQKSMKGKLFL